MPLRHGFDRRFRQAHRRSLVVAGMAGLCACGRLPYPTSEVDWTPSDLDLCGIEPAPKAVLFGEWDDASIGFDLAVADINGDGYADIATTVHSEDDYRTAALRLYDSAGGHFDTPPTDVWGLAEASMGASLVRLQDVDGDGRDDLGVGTRDESGEVDVWTTRIWSAKGDEPPAATDFEVAGGSALASVDADGDGLGDIVVGQDGVASLYLGAPGGPSMEPAATTTRAIDGFAADRMFAPGDVDGDGTGDLVVEGGVGRLYQLAGAGLVGAADSFADLESIEQMTGGDLDGDGLADLVTTVRDGYRGLVSWWTGAILGDQPAVEIAGETANSQLWAARVVADLDGDGDDELALGARATVVEGAEYAGQVAFHDGGPDGPASNPSQIVHATMANCFLGERFELGDVDGDGVPDLVARVGGVLELAPGGAIAVISGGGRWAP